MVKKTTRKSVKREVKKNSKKEIKPIVRKTTSPSKILGILSICFGILIPIFGILLGIIGLTVHDAEKYRYKYLSIIGIVLSITLWIFSAWVLMRNGGSLF